ncbi:MAG: DUF3826 domain-containing protein [Ferruginibacter sp.]
MKRFLLVNNNVLSFKNNKYSKSVPFVNSFISFTNSYLRFTLLAIVVLTASAVSAQNNTEEQQAAYKKAITERSAKIVNTLAITDSVKYKHVVSIISNQYFQLNTIQLQDDANTKIIKEKSTTKEETTAALKMKDDEKASQLSKLHQSYIAHLQEQLNEEQVEKVKDGMTYRVLPITWTAYMDMLQNLTQEQKDKMYAWLVEARELAMDQGSSDKKHAVFGKYKGKINNYLSAAGYDMKKEGEEWQKRIKERKSQTNKN